MKAIILLFAAVLNLNCFAKSANDRVPADTELNLDKVLDEEIEKCGSVIKMDSIIRYTMQAELGFLSQAQLRATLSDRLFREFEKVLSDVLPYMEELSKTGEVIPLKGKDATAVHCATLAKGLILGAQSNAVFGQLIPRNNGRKSK